MATRCCSFELRATLGAARTGLMHLPHGTVPTPCFMPVGTRGTVRGVTPGELQTAGASMVLANTYHLWVRPGHELVRELGGLHRFMGWEGPILTDSGGYQVFSLRDHVKLTEEGVRFRSPQDGAHRMLTPEVAVAIQEALGVDIAMVLDECLEFPATRERAVASTERTTRWLARAVAARQHAESTSLFGIVQGGMYPDLRAAHAEEIAALDLDGYAIGGLSVGEGRELLLEMTEVSAAHLPTDRPRYLMGVGFPVDIVKAVRRGIDLFDCVIPTRSGRHGQAFTSVGRFNLRNAVHVRAQDPLDPACDCQACTNFSRAYLSHLIRSDERLGGRLLTLHNLTFYQRLTAALRSAIAAGDEAALDAVESLADRASNAS